MNCRTCLRNGRTVDGGQLGVCKSHRKTKCVICRAPSLGAEMCATHEHEAELLRWEAEANFRVVDPTEQSEEEELRREKLMQAKFLMHRAVEIGFFSLLGVMKALWAKKLKPDDQKEAA